MQNYESTYDLTRIISIDISLIVGLKDLLLAHNRRNIRVLVTRVNIDFYRLFFQPLLKSNFIEKHRRSHRRRSVNKIVLKNFSKFTRKRLYWSLFFNKVTGLGLDIKIQNRRTLNLSFFPQVTKFVDQNFSRMLFARLGLCQPVIILPMREIQEITSC